MMSEQIETPLPLDPGLDRVERLTSEGLIGMPAASAVYGTTRRGRPTHPPTVARHCLKGVRLPGGRTLRLESIRVSNRLMTSRAAVLRFLAAQQVAEADSPTSPPPPPPSARQRASDAAGRQLAESGW